MGFSDHFEKDAPIMAVRARSNLDPELPWVPLYTVDLRGLQPKAFEALQKEFYLQTKDRPLELTKWLSTGWHTITPQIAEEALLGKANRHISLDDVKHYGRQMVEGKWMPTGETICIDATGVLREGYHRMWAAYLSGSSFRTFVVADVEPIPDLFAFYNAGRKRSNVDALQTAGMNGVSAMIAKVTQISVNYDRGCYNRQGPRAPRMTAVEVLGYVRAHPEMREIIAETVAEHKSLLTELFGVKADVACFVACRVTEAFGAEVFDDFMQSLSDETVKQGPIYLLRHKLEKDIGSAKPLAKKEMLAFVIMAFNAWQGGKGMKKLTWGVDEDMPRFMRADDANEADDKKLAAE
jgi:hypothetical protein